MGLPLRISDELVLRAREEAEVNDRSLTAQIEHWVKLGMAVEELLGYPEVAELKRRGKALSLEQAHAFAHSPEGKARARRHLLGRAGPRYAADPERADGVVRVEADGTRTRGRLVERVFVPEGDEPA